jgi:Uma2 family endonuclease
MTPELAPTSPPSTPAKDADPFRYGWREVPRTLPDGRVEWEQVPLTLEDVLHPQEGDVIPERPYHSGERAYLYEVCKSRADRIPDGVIFSDCLINWGVAGMGNHSPDISVFTGLAKPPDDNEGIFPVADQGAQCVLALELVSPHTRTNDVDKKPDHYHRAGVRCYVIVDQEKEAGPRKLLGYRHAPSGWEPMTPDAQGRLPLEPLGLLLGLRDNHVACYDADTGEEMGDYAQERKGRQAAEERVRQLEAELQRLRGTP